MGGVHVWSLSSDLRAKWEPRKEGSVIVGWNWKKNIPCLFGEQLCLAFSVTELLASTDVGMVRLSSIIHLFWFKIVRFLIMFVDFSLFLYLFYFLPFVVFSKTKSIIHIFQKILKFEKKSRTMLEIMWCSFKKCFKV